MVSEIPNEASSSLSFRCHLFLLPTWDRSHALSWLARHDSADVGAYSVELFGLLGLQKKDLLSDRFDYLLDSVSSFEHIVPQVLGYDVGIASE